MCWNIRCSWLQRANIQACQSDGPFQGGYFKLPDWLWVCETTWLDATVWDSILLSSGSPVSGIVIVSTANQQKIITFLATGDVGEIPVSWSARAFWRSRPPAIWGLTRNACPFHVVECLLQDKTLCCCAFYFDRMKLIITLLCLLMEESNR